MKNYLKQHREGLLIAILSTELAGLINSLISGNLNTQYQQMTKPWFAPSTLTFAIIWPSLYLLLAISTYCIYIGAAENSLRQICLDRYFIQLMVSFLWSITFFGFRNLPVSFSLILLLLFFVGMTIAAFQKNNFIAAILLIPYLLWLILLAALNLALLIAWP